MVKEKKITADKSGEGGWANVRDGSEKRMEYESSDRIYARETRLISLAPRSVA